VKNFKELREEMAANNTTNVASTPTAMNMTFRKTRPVTRHYIEVMGKRKRLLKKASTDPSAGGIDTSPL
jgi:hypothetical protein